MCLCAPTDISSGFHYYNKHLYRVYYGIKEMDFFLVAIMEKLFKVFEYHFSGINYRQL